MTAPDGDDNLFRHLVARLPRDALDRPVGRTEDGRRVGYADVLDLSARMGATLRAMAVGRATGSRCRRRKASRP